MVTNGWQRLMMAMLMMAATYCEVFRPRAGAWSVNPAVDECKLGKKNHVIRRGQLKNYDDS